MNLITSFVFLFSFQISAQSDEFSQPWLDTSMAIVIDSYGLNPINFQKLLTDRRVVGIIHKASQGFKTDDKLNERKKMTKQNGLLWGTYHLGTNDDPIEQADFYLKTVDYDSLQLIALDLESLDSTKFMSLYNAERFIQRIYEKTHRYPLLYCNKNVLEEINSKYTRNSVFARCGLWYARFRKEIPDFVPKVWSTYTLWQFSCEINCKKTGECLYNVPGTLFDMDINIYYGSIGDLRLKWPDINKH